MSMMSKRKGKTGELELAHMLTEAGFPARRGQQYSGTETSADVVAEGLELFHIECKRCEKTALDAWLDRADEDSGAGISGAFTKVPIIFHRKNSGEWIVILRAGFFLWLIRKLKHENAHD